MRFVIFGVGKMYQMYKSNFRKDIQIVAFVDNQADKWGQQVDGITVHAPAELKNMEYDIIFLLSFYYLDMQLQLRQMGIPEDKIYTIDNHIESLCVEEEIKYYGELNKDASKKKILIFSHALFFTGAQNVLYHAVCAMKKNGFQIAVVSKSDGILRERLEKLDIPVVIIKDIYSKKIAVKQLVDWSDIILVNTLLLYDAVLELSKYNKKLVWWIHETGILKYVGGEFRRIEENQHVSIYAVSPLVKRLIQQECGDEMKVGVLPYGLPLYEVENKANIYGKKMIFAVIGRIVYIKGQDIFLRAVSRLPAIIRENAEFWIVGEGELTPEELKVAEKHSCVKVLGEIEDTRMHEIYREIDVVICSSREDAMPVVVAEGCMAGKSAIVSDAVGTADLIEHGTTGLIFKSEDVDELAEQIKWAFEHEERMKQIGAEAKKVFRQYFSMDVFESNLLTIIGNETT